jgi:hypothetical protein
MNHSSTVVGVRTDQKWDEVVRINVRDLRDAYHRRAKWNRRFFRGTGVAVIVLSASLPLLAGFSYSGKDITIAIVGAVIAILTGLRAFYQWDQLWDFLRQSDFILTHLIGKWELDVEAAKHLPNTKSAVAIHKLTTELLDNAETVRQAESQRYFSTLRFPGGTDGEDGQDSGLPPT